MELEERRKKIQAELATASTLDPDDFESSFFRVESAEPGDAVALARELTRKHADRAWAWIALATSLSDKPEVAQEKHDALIRAVQADSNDPHALNSLAWDYATRGQPKVAIPLALKAVRLAPWNSAIVDTYAAALAGVGRCSEAVEVQRRAIDMLHDNASEESRKDYWQRLMKYEHDCKPQAAPTTSNASPH